MTETPLQESLKVLEKMRTEMERGRFSTAEERAALTAAIDALTWRSVETLPEDGMYLTLCYGGGKEILDVVQLKGGMWRIEHAEIIEAWMPIPEYGGSENG